MLDVRFVAGLSLLVALLISLGAEKVAAQGQLPVPNTPPTNAPRLPFTPESIGPGLLVPGQEFASQVVVDVRIGGNETVSEDKVISYLRTRPDRQFDPEVVKADKRRLIASGLFREVKIYTQSVAQGVVVTFEVFERPTIRHIRFLGDRGLSERALIRESGLAVGDALNLYSVQEGRRKIEEFYQRRGFPHARVEIMEGHQTSDRGVTFQISEGPLQRIAKVTFIGNEIASDQRLKSLIQSKPGFMWYLFRGKVDVQKIDEDIARLTEYYRSLGFFRARIGREMDYDDHQEWLTLRFVIDEGPRYVIRSVQVAGNTQFQEFDLRDRLQLKEGEFFNVGLMQRDLQTLRDLYGGQGHIFADVQADPRFRFDEPGALDLIYQIEEGEQFRVGRINIHIAGEFPHTKESVIRDRLSIRTGDIVDIREVRASERRLKASQLFENDPAAGKSPRIVIRPPQFSDAETLMTERGGPSVRGQAPESPGEVTMDIYLPPVVQTPTDPGVEVEHPSSTGNR